MNDYEPVSIASVCNAGVEVLGDAAADVQLGRVDMRGLSFLIGTEPPAKDRCFVVPEAPVSVEVGRAARRVVAAHRLLEPSAPAGHGAGRVVADSLFHLPGGASPSLPLRALL